MKIEELVAFVKVGREKLKAVRAEISAFDKMGLENEKRQKVVEQARELSEQLLDAEVSLGEIFATLPIAPGKRTDLEAPEDSDVQRSKKEILQQAGFSVKTAQRYEMLAAHGVQKESLATMKKVVSQVLEHMDEIDQATVKNFLGEFIDKVEILETPDIIKGVEYWVKSIKFKVPFNAGKPDEFDTFDVSHVFQPNESHVETVVLMSRVKD